MTETDASADPRAGTHAGNAMLAFFVGMLFAVTQFSYYFLLEVFLTSRAISYFVALFFWLSGFLVGINIRVKSTLTRILTAGVFAYYLLLLIVRRYPYNKYLLPLVGLCIAVSGLMPGCFFPFAYKRFKHVRQIFFHENNGFLAGIMLALISAVFAGKWMYQFAPVFGLLPVLMILRHQQKPPSLRPLDAGARHPRTTALDGFAVSNVMPFLVMGCHFGLLQICMFFTVQVYVTATYMGYFVIALAWMLGVLVNMKCRHGLSLVTSLILSVLAYYGMLGLATVFTPFRILLPLYFMLTVLAALPAGAFFRTFAPSAGARALFLHENNGFILGILLCMFGFIKWGVTFLYLAPLASAAFTLLLRTVPKACILCILPITTLLCLQFDNPPAFFVLLLLTLAGIINRFIPCPPPAGPVERNARENPRNATRETSEPLSRTQGSIILFLAGCNLILLQYFVTREFSSILAATELTILIVGTAYFAGLSIGYGASRFFTPSILKTAVFIMFFMHMAILLLVKTCAAYLIHAGLGMTAMFSLLFLSAFCTSSVYSVFLPTLIHSGRNISLVRAYAWDLCGAITGIAIMILFSTCAPSLFWPVYFLLMLTMLMILLHDSPWRNGVLLICLTTIGLLAVYQDKLRSYATEDYYRTRGYDHPRVIFAGDSLYHSIEVIDTFDDMPQSMPAMRTSFINGVPYFRYRIGKYHPPSGRETGLSEFTYFLAALPAQYLYQKTGRKLRILVMGGGSMYSLKRVGAYSGKTTLVEIDPLVVTSAKACWAALNQYDTLENYEIVIDDAAHFLKTTREKFDLIINDISAPYYLGTTLLHGRDFYALVKSKLKPDGLFAESTQGRPIPRSRDSQAMKILRGIADVFSKYRVIDCRGSPRGSRGYVFASEKFQFSTKELTAIMKRDGMYQGTSTYTETSAHFRLHAVVPYSLANMENLLAANVWRIKRRLDRKNEDATHASSIKMLCDMMCNPRNVMHSRLIAALRQKIRTPSFICVILLEILAMILLYRKRQAQT